ncbi:phosphoethanolamine transferase [Gilliamella sp. wkB112]|uniref:phosphoethanolamine transferase n=1 Tax=Gilliamella sp. wkB112 TaxID=3120257 RepID=UPI00080EB859|nr:phosphoethanolamine transferase [Gilliamella apicola]OCG00895.1 hypothetical protein A9G12_03810 [Gilliamella apicola]
MIKKENLLSHFICLGLSVLVVYLLGYPQRFDRILLTYFSLIFLARFTICRMIFCISFIVAALYFPTSFYYGSPNIAVISSIAETDTDEISEYLTQLPIYLYVITILLVIGFIFIFSKCNFPKINNKYLIICALIVSCYKPAKIIIKSNFSNIPYILVDSFKYPFFEFYFDLYTSNKIYLTEKQEQQKQAQQLNNIPIVKVKPKHKTFLIIIGESVRKDYMSVYGFKYDNTPFTKQYASIIWDGLIAPASNTQASIPHLISQSIFTEDNKLVNAQLNNNIISIANEAGFETYWLSNQGKLGKMEITIPRIASYAQNSFYTKKGEYNGKSTRDKNDTLLLPELENIVSLQSDKPRLIVMHLIGSHPHFCKRLQFDVQFDLNNENISCYVSSIKETDDLMSSAINILQKHHQDYSLVYFADHGLAHIEQYQDLRHNWEYQNSYQVPFIFFDSNNTEQQKINKQISGFQLVYLLSHWMGIELDVKHDYMQHELNDITEQKDIKVKDWRNELFLFDKLKDDPNPF